MVENRIDMLPAKLHVLSRITASRKGTMAEWVHTFKGAVLASEYDSASHMNSRMYVSRFDQATWFLLQSMA